MYHVCFVYQDGKTALIVASSNGHTDIAKYLVDTKAGLDIQNKVSMNCVHAQMYVYLYVGIYMSACSSPCPELLTPLMS